MHSLSNNELLFINICAKLTLTMNLFSAAPRFRPQTPFVGLPRITPTGSPSALVFQTRQPFGSIHRVLGCVVALEMTDEMFAPRDSCPSIRTGALRSRRQVCSRASAAQLNDMRRDAMHNIACEAVEETWKHHCPYGAVMKMRLHA